MVSSDQIFDVHFLLNVFPQVMPYYPTTLLIVLVAYCSGLVIGFGCALIRLYHVPVAYQVVGFYLSFTRGTPLLVQLYLFYFGIPIIIRLINANFHTTIPVQGIPALLSVFIAFGLNEGAYMTETIRGAIVSVDRAPIEAAKAFGFTNAQTMRRIVLPDAIRIAIPNLGNMFLGLLKNTSLAFTVSVMDIMAQGKILGSQGYRFFEVYIALAVIYWISCAVSGIFIRLIERRSSLARRSITD